MKKKQMSLWLFALLVALALGGCNSRQAPAESPSPAEPAPVETENPTAPAEKPVENLGPSWGAKNFSSLLKDSYPDIDDWELLFDESALWEAEGYEAKIQGCSLLATEEGAGFDRLLLYSLGPVGQALPEETELLLTVEGKEADWQLGDGEGITLSYAAAEPWYPNLWLPEEGRALLLDSIHGSLLPLRCEEEPPALFVAQPLAEFWPQGNYEDSLLYILPLEEQDHSLWRLCYYEAETQETTLLGDQSEGFLQTYPLEGGVIACVGPEKVSFYDMATEEPWEAFNVLEKGDGQNFLHMLWTDRDYPQRQLLCYTDESDGLGLLLVDSRGQVLEDFPLGLEEGQALDGSFAGGIFYFSYRPKEDAALSSFPADENGYLHLAVDVRPGKNHSLQVWER